MAGRNILKRYDTMWKNCESDGYLRQAKDFVKRHRREWVAVIENLDTYRMALDEGANPYHVSYRFVHSERKGALAITEQGGGKSLKATRLYVYPEVETSLIHLISINGKDTQDQDVKASHAFIEQRKRTLANDHESYQQRSGPGAPHFGRPRTREGVGSSDSASSGSQEAHGH